MTVDTWKALATRGLTQKYITIREIVELTGLATRSVSSWLAYHHIRKIRDHRDYRPGIPDSAGRYLLAEIINEAEKGSGKGNRIKGETRSLINRQSQEKLREQREQLNMNRRGADSNADTAS